MTTRDITHSEIEQDGFQVIPSTPEFQSFSKIARLNRDIVITEKIDGTNAQVLITEDGLVVAGSRSRYLTTKEDNFGFARWVEGNKSELLKLGPGRHFGEWWGAGIQRRYGLSEKRFSLFNVHRWLDCSLEGRPDSPPPCAPNQDYCPECCHVVPVLYRGPFSRTEIALTLTDLRANGSAAAPGYTHPEGIVIYHTAAKQLFKVTLENDSEPKGKLC